MSKIIEVETIPFRLPMAGSLKWGVASRMDMLEHVLVKIITDAGQVGLAEAPPRPTIYGETIESVQAIIHKHLAPMIIGQSIESMTDIERINRQMSVIVNNHTAKGAIDICLHEVLMINQGKCLFDNFPTGNKKVKVSYILGIADRETMLTEAKAVYDKGVRVLKVKVGRNFTDDLKRIKELQTEFSDLQLYADANETLLSDQATNQLRQLVELGILYVEEPLPIEQIANRQSLREKNILPLIADDSTFTQRDLSRELYFNTFDILNIKTARTGYTQSGQMLALARQHGKGVMVGSQASSTIGTIRTALFAAQPGIEHPSELSFFLKLKDEIVNRPIEIVDGYIDIESLRDITIDEQKLKRLKIS